MIDCCTYLSDEGWVLTTTKAEYACWKKGEGVVVVKHLDNDGIEVWFKPSSNAEIRHGKGLNFLGHCIDERYLSTIILSLIDYDPEPTRPYDPEYPAWNWWASRGRTLAAGQLVDVAEVMPYFLNDRTDHLYLSCS